MPSTRWRSSRRRYQGRCGGAPAFLVARRYCGCVLTTWLRCFFLLVRDRSDDYGQVTRLFRLPRPPEAPKPSMNMRVRRGGDAGDALWAHLLSIYTHVRVCTSRYIHYFFSLYILLYTKSASPASPILQNPIHGAGFRGDAPGDAPANRHCVTRCVTLGGPLRFSAASCPSRREQEEEGEEHRGQQAAAKEGWTMGVLHSWPLMFRIHAAPVTMGAEFWQRRSSRA